MTSAKVDGLVFSVKAAAGVRRREWNEKIAGDLGYPTAMILDRTPYGAMRSALRRYGKEVLGLPNAGFAVFPREKPQINGFELWRVNSEEQQIGTSPLLHTKIQSTGQILVAPYSSDYINLFNDELSRVDHTQVSKAVIEIATRHWQAEMLDQGSGFYWVHGRYADALQAVNDAMRAIEAGNIRRFTWTADADSVQWVREQVQERLAVEARAIEEEVTAAIHEEHTPEWWDTRLARIVRLKDQAHQIEDDLQVGMSSSTESLEKLRIAIATAAMATLS